MTTASTRNQTYAGFPTDAGPAGPDGAAGHVAMGAVPVEGRAAPGAPEGAGPYGYGGPDPVGAPGPVGSGRPSSDRRDVIVIGGGINGLTAAAYLAKAGLGVTLVEARDGLGGMAANGDIEPEFSMPVCAHLLSHLHKDIIKDLGLYKHGLTYAARRLETTALDEDGAHLTLPSDPVRARAAIGQISPQDAETYGPFLARMMRLAEALSPGLLAAPAAGAAGRDPNAAAQAAARALRRLTPDDLRVLGQAGHGRVNDLLERDFDHPLLSGLFAFDASLGGTQPPSAPGTILPWLHRLMGECAGMRGALGLPKGGIGAVAAALRTSAATHGADIRLGVPVRSILVEAGRAAGVVLGDGTRLRSSSVVSSLDPQTTCLGLLGPNYLDVELVRRLKRWRSRGVTGKVNLSLNGLPRVRGLGPEHLGGRLVLCPSAAYLDSAFRPVKYGEMSPFPALEVIIPSLTDPELAPPGCHVMSVIVQYVPYLASAEANEALRRQLAKAVIDRLSFHAPDLPDLARKVAVLTPRDLEAAFGTRGGHWHQGDIAPDQIWSHREMSGLGVEGLTLCGAGSHPGGGVSGLAGRRAAKAVVAELETSR